MRLLVFLCCMSTLSVVGQVLEWQFKHPVSGKWFKLGVRGSVQEALVEAGELPDPFVGTNEKLFQWIERYNWEFKSDFVLSEADFKKNRIDLELPNVDTYAKIYLNNKLIGSTENCYVVYRFDVKKYAKAGRNSIRMVFESPVAYQKKHMAEVGVILPSPNDLGEVSAAPYCRKPQYQFGWDWALRMTTIGFWNPVQVIAFNDNRVIGKNIRTLSVNEQEAVVEFTLILRHPTTDTLLWKSQFYGDVKVVPQNGIVKRIVKEKNPQCWWPRGHGEQHLYADTWNLQPLTGGKYFHQDIYFGIRTTELITQPDQWGTSYIVRINGKDIFCKGANYIPQDIFPARVSHLQIRNYVKQMKDANFNMVRIWGGGYYPDEGFYEACDEAGIMVWQDFMFACAMYPGNKEFIANVKQEFAQQIPRIASHPSVVLFNGNNEVDVAWKNWGFMETYKLSKKDSVLITQYYNKLFKEVIPEAVSEWTDVPYVHTSPLSNWGKDEYFNHGTMHYWGVWHGKDAIEDFGRKTGRFNAEYGFQSFPEYATLSSFSDTSQWDLLSEVMRHHQKSYVGNGMIEKHASLLYGKTTDFRRFVYYSQLTQATAVSMAISGHRTNMPRCSGTIFWQLNDCWPAPTWSSIDYFGNWKALQYAVKQDFRDVAILAKTDTIGKERYFFVSDLYKGFACKITAELFDLDGKQLDTFSCNLAVINRSVQEVFKTELAPHRHSNYFIRFHWNAADGSKLTRDFTHLSQPVPSATKGQVKLELLQVDPQTKTAVIRITNEAFVQQLWITSAKQGVRFDRNFIDLIPGTHDVKISFENLPALSDFELIWL